MLFKTRTAPIHCRHVVENLGLSGPIFHADSVPGIPSELSRQTITEFHFAVHHFAP